MKNYDTRTKPDKARLTPIPGGFYRLLHRCCFCQLIWMEHRAFDDISNYIALFFIGKIIGGFRG